MKINHYVKKRHGATQSVDMCQFNKLMQTTNYYTKEELIRCEDFDRFWMRWWNDNLNKHPQITEQEMLYYEQNRR